MTAARDPRLGTDPGKWADEFMRLHGNVLPDRSNMLGWFANAIMAGHDAASRPVSSRKLIAQLDDPCIAAAVNEKGGGRGS